MKDNLLTFEDLENLKLAEDLAKTCFEMYSVTSTGLAPEIAYFHTEVGWTYQNTITLLHTVNIWMVLKWIIIYHFILLPLKTVKEIWHLVPIDAGLFWTRSWWWEQKFRIHEWHNHQICWSSQSSSPWNCWIFICPLSYNRKPKVCF